MNVHLTRVSRNKKTGPIPVSTTSKDSCPSNCALKRNGCYADRGPIAIHWEKVTNGERGYAWEQFCAEIKALPKGQLWRHNQAGDLPSLGNKNYLIDPYKLNELVLANNFKKGFTYTHYNVLDYPWNRADVLQANLYGFTINLSADNPEHADALADLNIGPVVTLLPQDVVEAPKFTPKGRSIVICPAIDSDTITCSTCQVCANPSRKAIIGFPASTNKANEVCCSTRYGV